MKIIEQQCWIEDRLNPVSILRKLERIGRVCYKSEDRIGVVDCPHCVLDSKGRLKSCVWERWHLPASRSLFKVPTAMPFVERQIVGRGHLSVIEHVSITVRFVTDLGVTHEQVRHRLCSFSQESTRYVSYAKRGAQFIKPVDWELTSEDKKFLESIEHYYVKRLGDGLTPQQARYFLPKGLKTEIVHTANLREWRHILDLRTSPAAHPQIRALMRDLLSQFKSRLPIIFDDILPG